MKNETFNVTTPTDLEIVMTREFNAPRRLVWDTMSKPELLKRWLFGPQDWTLEVVEDEQRPGGAFRWVWRGADGIEMTMNGVYREVVPPERNVRTEAFTLGGQFLGEQLATLVLDDKGEKTALRLTLLFESKEARDGALASGMANGVAVSYERLDEILASAVTEGSEA